MKTMHITIDFTRIQKQHIATATLEEVKKHDQRICPSILRTKISFFGIRMVETLVQPLKCGRKQKNGI
jgi:hypothetical protein